jgi:hypothetical protein
MALLPSSAIPSASGGYTIDQSLRFNDDDDASLNKTWGSSPTEANRFTFSVWVKRGVLDSSTAQYWLLGAKSSAESNIKFYEDKLYLHLTGSNYDFITDAVFRDTSAWYHIVVTYDSDDGTPADRCKIYVNGVRQSLSTSTTIPSGTDNEFTKNGTECWIGSHDASNFHFDGYMADVYLIDGTAYDADDFGEEGDYGEWKPKEVTGLTYGTNGFYLDFSNTAIKHDITASGDAQHSTSENKIGSSSLYFDGSGDYLTVPNHEDLWFSSGNGTIEFWFLDPSVNTAVNNKGVFTTEAGTGSTSFDVQYDSGFTFRLRTTGGTNEDNYVTDPSDDTWTHYALVLNNGVAKLYVDGTLENTYSNDYSDGLYHTTDDLRIGRSGSNHDYWNGYLDEIRISNNARYTGNFTPSTTAFTDDDNTLLLIHSNTSDGSTTFTDSSGVEGNLGNDQSGEDNHFTPNNLTASDQMLDSPTNNFCTFNPIGKLHDSYTSGTMSEGNLKTHLSSPDAENFGTMAQSTGKWYWEVYTAVSGAIPIIATFDLKTHKGGSSTRSYISVSGGTPTVYDNGSESTAAPSTPSHSATDVLGVALDLDNGALYTSINGTWSNSGDPTSGASKTGATVTSSVHTRLASGVGEWTPAYMDGSGNDYGIILNCGQDSSFAGNKTSQGNQDGNEIGDFYYTPPTDFLALCTSNLPDVDITPSEHFNTVLYSGNGTTQSITGVNFQPDFTWIKQRSGTRSHGFLDSIRGGGEVLFSNNDAAEASTTNTITSFDSDGFSLGNQTMTNESGTYVAWNWKAGTSVSGDTAGSGTAKTYTGSVNADAGFSIIGYEGNGTNGHKIYHHLNEAPEMVIIKNRENTSGTNWGVYNYKLADTQGIKLNSYQGATTENWYQDTDPTSTIVELRGASTVNEDTKDHIAYCFHSVDGYSKVGSYTGNADADGTFVYTGFRPMWIMCKRTTSNHDWDIYDSKRTTYNPMGIPLRANDNVAEGATGDMDLLSNGFKHRQSANANGSGDYIYLAFAETPFKYANAR